MVHGDLNAANIMVDLHGNPWYIDFADVKIDLPMTDIAKLCNVIILEYTLFPISRAEAVNLTAADLAAQLRCVKALNAVKDLKKHLGNPETSIPDAVTEAFQTFQDGKFAEFFDSIHGRLTEDQGWRSLFLCNLPDASEGTIQRSLSLGGEVWNRRRMWQECRSELLGRCPICERLVLNIDDSCLEHLRK